MHRLFSFMNVSEKYMNNDDNDDMDGNDNYSNNDNK